MFERFRTAASADGITVADIDWPDDDPAWNHAAALLKNAIADVFQLNFDRADELLTLALEDVLDEAAHHPDNTVTTGWFQFQLADAGTQLALAHRRFDRVFEWLLRPLVDTIDIPAESNLPLARVAGIAHGWWVDDPATRRTLRQYALTWLRAFFFYTHRVNHLTDVANNLTDLAYSLAMEGHVNGVPVAVALFGWLTATDPTPDDRRTRLLRLIAAAEADAHVPDGARIECALTIATAPLEYFDPSTTIEVRRNTRARIAAELQDRWSDKLVNHQRLQFLISQLADQPEDLNAHHDHVLAAIDEYLDDLARTAQQQGPHAAYYQRGRLFSLIAPIIRTALLAGNLDHATEILARWRGVPPGQQLETQLFHLSAEPNGTHWIWPGNDRCAVNPEAMITSVIATNRFLRVHTTVANVHEIKLEPLDDPTRLGDPDPHAAPAFAEASANLIRTDLITDHAPQLPTATTALVPIPGQTLPWQPHLARQQLPVWPISSSLRHPENDRPPHRIVIWDSGELWSAELELEALRTVTAHATDTTIETITAGTAEHFTNVYRDPSIDILWVISHGDHDHYNPHQSRIPINSVEHVTLNDLLAAQPTWNGRRLLVLNSCDGAAAATYGGPTDFGFAPTLASHQQAVISHLWPVDSFHVAPAFGAILMAELINQQPYTEAFANSLRHLVQGWDVVAAELERLGATRLADAARHTSIDLNDVTYWGTPALFV